MSTPDKTKTPQKQEFDATIVIHNDGGASFALPFDVKEAFGKQGVLPVKGTIDGIPYRGQINPIGDGRHYMVVDTDIQKRIEPENHRVEVTMELADDSGRDLNLPDDFYEALIRDGVAMTVFEKLPENERQELIQWVEDSERSDIRLRRINKAIQLLLESIKR